MSNKNAVWRIVEQQVADALGFKRIAFSGGIWPNKEDAEDLDFICQMKATEGKGITIKIDDIDALMRRALVQHKCPVFVFHLERGEFSSGKTWVAVPLDEFKELKQTKGEELNNEN
jgi:hypothetical protein